MSNSPDLPRQCDHCKSADLYTTKVNSGGGYAPNYLPQLSTKWWATPSLDVVLCAQCGKTQMFAPKESLEKLSTSTKWRKL